MFRQPSPSQIAAASGDASSPVMDTFHVHPCPPFRRNEYMYAVRVSRSNCSEDDIGSAARPDSDGSQDSTDNCSTSLRKKIGLKDTPQRAVSALNTAIKEFRTISNSVTRQDKAKGNKDDIFFAMGAFEDYFIGFAEEKLNDTSPKFTYQSNQLDFRVQRILMHQHNESEFLLNGNYIKIPSRNLQHGSVVLGVTYNNIHELLTSNHSAGINKTNQTRWLNTIIMSAVIYPSPGVLQENVTLVFESIEAAGKNRECVFWNFSEENPEGWSGQGCKTRIINSSLTECLCNHLTHFAVLMDYADSGDSGGPTKPSTEDDKILTVLTRVGMSLSLTGVVLTVISYLLLTDRHTPLSHIRVSLASSIGAGHVIFLAGIDATENKDACVAVAALLQYFLMAAFCWMLVEGIYLYLFVVKVYNIVDKMRVYQAISWGLPAVIVALSLGIAAGKDGIQSFVSDKYLTPLSWCELSRR